MAQEPLLNLSTLVAREHILIDGKGYELRNKDELSIIDLEAFTNHGKRIIELSNRSEDFTDAEMEEMDRHMVSCLKRIFASVPNDVIDRLTLVQKTSIITVFSNLLGVPISTGEARAELKQTEGTIGD